jgi:aspartyl-tRNA(Asn)/glutamyl-tRNA(Gln) amidotransferase subunit A
MLRELRVGVPRGHGADCPDAHPAAIKGLMDIATALAHAGAEIQPIDLPPLWAFSAVSSIVVAYEGWRVHGERLATEGRRYAPITRLRLGLGAFIDDALYDKALRCRDDLTAAWESFFDKTDIMLSLGSPGPAPPSSAISAFAYLMTPVLFSPANIAGAPALITRAGTSADGLPIGIQIAGRRGDDRRVLAVGQALERLVDPQPPHPIGYD